MMLPLAPPQGRFSNGNPHVIPAGATQVQQNWECREPGQWDVRAGCRPVTFANAGSQVTGADVLSMTSFKTPTGWRVVLLLSDGKVRMGRSPT